MKIIEKDNFDRESVADVLVADNITSLDYAKTMVEALNRHSGYNRLKYFQVVNDDYQLWRGMEEFV